MKSIPEQLKELTFKKAGVSHTLTGRQARQQLNGVMQRSSTQMTLPIPVAIRKHRRRMLEALADERPVWDQHDDVGNPAKTATVVWPKSVPQRVLAVIDQDGKVIPGEGTTPGQVKEIEDFLEQTNVQDKKDSQPP